MNSNNSTVLVCFLDHHVTGDRMETVRTNCGAVVRQRFFEAGDRLEVMLVSCEKINRDMFIPKDKGLVIRAGGLCKD